MNDIAIRVDHLGKRYRIQQGRRAEYETLRERLTELCAAPFRRLKRRRAAELSHTPDENHVWALDDVSFEIHEGEVVGIIGRNGAGKSTLLKILSRITEPTEGRAEVFGRVGSLLEVGTGFHPELTGRENIFLNGAIMGMRKAEILRKFDEMVNFAELEKFIDTPVKFYSNGMYVRLAFAVAAHLEPEILMVDEVLAVGDSAFQNKCLGKMGDVAKEGRTVFFVSHNMGSIQSLCTKVLLMEKGRLIEVGNPAQVIRDYLADTSLSHFQGSDLKLRDPRVSIQEIFVEQNGFQNPAFLEPSEAVKVIVRYRLNEELSRLLLGFDVYSSEGVHLFRTYDLAGYGMGQRPPGEYVSVLTLPPDTFQQNTYFFDLVLGVHRMGFITRNEIRINLAFGGARKIDVTYPGTLQPIGAWEVRQTSGVEQIAQPV